jgi:hypothetical protein
MNGKSIREQYKDCYRLIRLQQQSLALHDIKSHREILADLCPYSLSAYAAAYLSWRERVGGSVGMRQWRKLYARKVRLQLLATYDDDFANADFWVELGQGI